MTWRKAWERSWDEVKYCSDACRKHKVSPRDTALEQAVLTLLASRQPGQTICPSEAARVVGGEEWEELMEPARRAGRRLVASGQLEITQKGRVVDPSSFRGPVRFRLREIR
jgi:Protein of unknown function (DUF3253)/Uncharacterized protein conserved in bacteria (DUF2256)